MWAMTINVKKRLFATLLLLPIYQIENQTNIVFSGAIVKIAEDRCNN
jgi:hypothetical protein